MTDKCLLFMFMHGEAGGGVSDLVAKGSIDELKAHAENNPDTSLCAQIVDHETMEELLSGCWKQGQLESGAIMRFYDWSDPNKI